MRDVFIEGGPTGTNEGWSSQGHEAHQLQRLQLYYLVPNHNLHRGLQVWQLGQEL